MADPEIKAMEAISNALGTLKDEESRIRVLTWAGAKFAGNKLPAGTASAQVAQVKVDATDLPSLLDQAQPKTNEERALIAAYFQSGQEKNDFDSLSVNKLLKNVGHVVGNITSTLTLLMKRKPALVIQVMKSGKTKQARKKYRLTDAGSKAAHAMLTAGKHLSGDKEE